MATLYRIIVILIVTVLLGGLMYAGVTASNSSDAPSFEGGRPQFQEGGEQFRPDGDEDGFRPEREGHDERGEGGIRLPGGVVKALVLMSIAGGIYSVVTWTGKKAKQLTAS